MTKTKPTPNIELKSLIILLKKEKSTFWKAVAKNLEIPTRRKRTISLSKINKLAKDKEIIVVPGKVLSQGTLEKNVKVAAYQFSEAAKTKLKSNALTIHELLKQKPKTSELRILV